MKGNLIPAVLSLVFLSANAFAVEIPECEVRGVKPTDKISTFEFNPSLTVIDDEAGISETAMTLKYYYSFNKIFSIGTEVPIKRFESRDSSKNGIGDILVSASAIKKEEKLSFGTTWEFYLPAAKYDELGAGKWQFSPAVFAEYEIVPQVFFALGYKHYVSVAGPSSRNDINKGRIRTMAAYISDHNWWVLFDPKYYMDYEDNSDEFIIEIETGIMLFDEISMYLKPGWHAGGSDKSMDWSVSFGVKLLSI